VTVAAAAGIDAATLNRIERGRIQRPQEATLKAIAGALGVNLNDLIDPDALLVHGLHRPVPASESRGAPDDLPLALRMMREMVQEAQKTAMEALVKAEAAQAKADEALRQVVRRGRRSA
jgi:transcriptional regulator with XRE-family HTH domain